VNYLGARFQVNNLRAALNDLGLVAYYKTEDVFIAGYTNGGFAGVTNAGSLGIFLARFDKLTNLYK
jgi:hypothetical protein